MRFARPRSRRPTEPALPMINVVFLLLIFFLMSAQIAPPPPFPVTPPVAGADATGEAQGAHVLYLDADGDLAFGAARGTAVWDALETTPDRKVANLLIRADAALPANRLAATLSRAATLGFAQTLLVTVPR